MANIQFLLTIIIEFKFTGYLLYCVIPWFLIPDFVGPWRQMACAENRASMIVQTAEQVFRSRAEEMLGCNTNNASEELF